jgi:hypothetical protein
MLTKTTSKLALGTSSTLLAAALIGPACVSRAQGVAERAGQALDDVGRGVRRGFQTAFARTRVAVDNQEVISRVYSRLHWDKMLVGSNLELEVQDGGTTVIRGAVPDAAARERAVLLARDTVGVAQVVDELTVLPPPRVILSTPPTLTPTPTPAETTTKAVIKP